jgi:hypothetical protein
MTALFYVFLYLLGFLIVLPLARNIPLWLLSASGFAWGLLIWMAGSLVILFAGVQFNWLPMGLLLTPLAAAALILNLRFKTFKIAAQQPLPFLAGLLVVSALAWLLTRYSYVYATTDSFNYINHGTVLARSGLVPWTIDSFSKLGSFSSLIQMNSQLLPGDFLSGYQTILAVSLLVVVFFSSLKVLQERFSKLVSLGISALLILLLCSKIFLNHSFYIHNNLPAALLMFLCVYAFWNFIASDSSEWAILGVAGLIGFSFTRIEGPLYAALILLLVIGSKELPYRRILGLVLPYTTIALLWHLFLLTSVTQNAILSQTNLLLIIAALGGLTLLALASKWLIPLLNVLPEIILALLASGLALLILIEPDHMITSLTHFWQNLTNIYFWGWTWFAVLAFVPFIYPDRSSLPRNRMLTFCFAGFVLIILALSIARNPYRLGQTDSANRLMLQILPLILFAVAANAEKLKRWLSPGKDPE